MEHAGESVVTSFVALEKCEALEVWGAVEDNSLELLGVEHDCLGFDECLDPARSAEVDVDYGPVNFLGELLFLFFDLDVPSEELVNVNFDLVGLGLLVDFCQFCCLGGRVFESKSLE